MAGTLDSAAINAFFFGQLGDEAEIGNLELEAKRRLKREMNKKGTLGVEGYSGVEVFRTPNRSDQQRHRLDRSPTTKAAAMTVSPSGS